MPTAGLQRLITGNVIQWGMSRFHSDLLGRAAHGQTGFLPMFGLTHSLRHGAVTGKHVFEKPANCQICQRAQTKFWRPALTTQAMPRE